MLTLHLIPVSHPCRAVEAALRLKGLDYERVIVPPPHTQAMEDIYGEGNGTVPGMLFDGEPVHGSRPIMARLESLAPDPALYPEPIADAVREAEAWADGELQDLGRRLPWGAAHFRPEMFGIFGGAGQLDPAGTDYAIRFIRAGWKYHGISAERLHADLQALPALLDQADRYAREGTIGGDAPNAADLQIGATVRALLTVGDLVPVIAGRPCETIARRWTEDYDGEIPAGAFPAGWVPLS